MGSKNIFTGTVLWVVLGIFFSINLIIIAFIFVWNR